MQSLTNLDEYLGGIAIGIRFRANFSIEDQLGKIIDTILYSEDSFFNSTVFPQVGSGIGERGLLNPKNNDSLQIDNSNVVLQVSLDGANATFSRKDLRGIVDAFKRQVINGVLKEFKIKEINRVGFVTRYLFPIEPLSTVFVNKTVGGTLSGINDINLRFSKKYPSQETLVRKGVLDYYNAIYTIVKKSDKSEIFMSVDYQKCFDPFLSSASDIGFDEFMARVNAYNGETFLGWIRDNYLKA